MTDGEIIAALAKAEVPASLLMAVASRLARKQPKQVAPTEEESALFERLWKFRQTFTRRPGDPKKPALLKFVRQIRDKPASYEEIAFGIRCEYSAKKEKPEHYAQMETFMNQRRWETYDFAAYQARQQQRANPGNVTPIRAVKPANHFTNIWKSRESA